jgi:hypothetical protein
LPVKRVFREPGSGDLMTETYSFSLNPTLATDFFDPRRIVREMKLEAQVVAAEEPAARLLHGALWGDEDLVRKALEADADANARTAALVGSQGLSFRHSCWPLCPGASSSLSGWLKRERKLMPVLLAAQPPLILQLFTITPKLLSGLGVMAGRKASGFHDNERPDARAGLQPWKDALVSAAARRRTTALHWTPDGALFRYRRSLAGRQ